jgi:hypothetical protein
MNPKKEGRLFIVFMIALLAYGFASSANALNIGSDIGVGIFPSNFNFETGQKISEIGDPSFTPVTVVRRIPINITNVTNTTNKTPINNTPPQNQTNTTP